MKHEKQIEWLDDPSRFDFVCAGRRGGKTKGVIEKICEKIHHAPHGGKVFYIGPTLQQAYELIWDDIQDRFDELGWKYTDAISKRRFEFSKGRMLYVIGAEKIRRVRGHKAWHIFMDEVAFFEQPLTKIWEAVRPALSDLRGGATLTTTPNGKNSDAYNFYLKIVNQEGWKYFQWYTLDNPYIDPDEIEEARRTMDAKSFRQEYEASWESFEGLAYYSFNDKLHIHKQELKPDLAFDMLFDFNVNPTSLLIAQYDGIARVKKEYSLKNSSTIETTKKFLEEFKEQRPYVRIFGDASGNNRSSNTGRADYHYIIELLKDYGFKYDYCVQSSNPPIVDRVMHVNSWLQNWHGESRVEIDPSCTDLIKDLSSQETLGRIPTDKGNLGHKADAFGYYIHMLMMTSGRKKQGTTIL